MEIYRRKNTEKLNSDEEVKENKGLTEKLYVTTCQLEEKVVANTLQQTEENIGEGAPESSSTEDEKVFDNVEGFGVLTSLPSPKHLLLNVLLN